MKAIYLRKHGGAHDAFALQEVPRPRPAAGQVGIAVEAFGLNFADVLARQGMYREAPAPPCVIGYDLVGRVDAVGEGVDPAWLGKRVAALTRFNAYAEYAVTPAQGCVEVPEEMPAHAACALGTQFSTAYYAAMVVQQAQPGERILVHAAAGGVGSALVQLLRWRGCIVYATAGSDEKVNALQEQGLFAVNYRTHDYEEVLRDALMGERLDISFNSIAGTTFRKDMRLLGAGGRLVLYGFAERSGRRGGKLATVAFLARMGLVMPILLMATSKSILGVNMLKIGDHRPAVIQRCMQALVELWKQGHIAPVNGGEFRPEEIGKAHEHMELRRGSGKMIVRW